MQSCFPLLQRLFVPVLALALAAAGGAASASGNGRAHLRVSAMVKPFASMVLQPPASFAVTEADVARGYVDVPEAVALSVHSNVPQGYVLVFERSGPQVREAQVFGLQTQVVVADGGAMASRNAAGRGVWGEQLQLRFRFHLAPQTAPGNHAWPLQISMASS